MIPEDRWALVAPHRARLVALARRTLRGTDAAAGAEDVVHEALLRVAAAEHVDARAVADVLDIAVVRLCLSSDARAERRAKILARRTAGAERLEPVPEDALADASFDRWALAEVRRLLPRLSALERDVLLSRAAGVTLPETAARLGVTYKGADNAYRRARTRLRSLTGFSACLAACSALRRVLRGATPVGAAGALAIVAAASVALTIPGVIDVRHRPRPQAEGSRAAALTARPAVAETGSKLDPVSGSPRAERHEDRPAAPRSPGARARITAPATSVGPAEKGTTEVTVSDEDPVSALGRCVKYGVDVAIGPQGGVTCREGPGEAAAVHP